MADAPKKSLHWVKSTLWAALWSTVLTTFIVFAIQANNHCFLIVNGSAWTWTIAVVIWLWLLPFLLLGNRGRLILLGVTVLGYVALPNVDRFPTTVAEARAVMHLRRLSQAVEAYRDAHTTEGYPTNLPTISRGDETESTEELYKIEYATSRSLSGGPADEFVIQANPVWRDCGFIRSFAATDDGKIHFTLESRPATKSDEPLQ